MQNDLADIDKQEELKTKKSWQDMIEETALAKKCNMLNYKATLDIQDEYVFDAQKLPIF